MKLPVFVSILTMCAVPAAVAQQAPAPQQAQVPFPQAAKPPEAIAPDTVVARVGDRAITAAEAEKMTTGINAQWYAALPKDPKGVLGAILTMEHVAKMAVLEGMDQKSPVKEQIEFLRKQVLMQAEIVKKTNELIPTIEETEEAYKKNAAKYEQAKLQVIYISFVSGTPAAGSKALTEDQAKAKAEGIVKQLRGGADFAAMVKQHSEDEMSKARGGDFGSIKRGDSLPEDLKSAVFALKEGEYSDPIKQPNGYYIFRMVEKSSAPLDEVRQKLTDELRQAKFQAWLRGIQEQYQVTVEKPEFFQRMAK